MASRKEEDLTKRYGHYVSPVPGAEQQPMMLSHPQGHLLMQQQQQCCQPGYAQQTPVGIQPSVTYRQVQTPVNVRSVASMSQQPGTYEQVLQQQMQQQMTPQQQQQLQQALLQQQMLAMQQKQQQQQQQQQQQPSGQPSAAILAQLQRQQMSPQQPGHIYRQQQPY